MTAQFGDSFVFQGNEFDLLSVEGGELFSPESLGMTPTMMHSANDRGFVCRYEISDSRLLLRHLLLRVRGGGFCPIDGVLPALDGEYGEYKGLARIVPFTGRLLFARDRRERTLPEDRRLSAFRTVYRLTLAEGVVTAVEDLSVPDPPDDAE